MNSKVFTVLRIVLGLMLLVFGSNKFFNFLPAPEGMSEAAGTFFGALMSTKTLYLVAVVEVAAGLAFVLNKFGALMAIILMSVSINAVMYHLSLDMANIGPALVLLVLNIVVLCSYKSKYKELLS